MSTVGEHTLLISKRRKKCQVQILKSRFLHEKIIFFDLDFFLCPRIDLYLQKMTSTTSRTVTATNGPVFYSKTTSFRELFVEGFICGSELIRCFLPFDGCQYPFVRAVDGRPGPQNIFLNWRGVERGRWLLDGHRYQCLCFIFIIHLLNFFFFKC